MKNEKINKKIINIASKYFNDFESPAAPVFYDNFKKGGILFIGMNPSCGGLNSKLISSDQKKLLLWNNGNDIESKVDKIIDIEKIFIDKYPYFKLMKNICDLSDLKNKHFLNIDIFILKETNQKKFVKDIVKSEDSKSIILNDFGLEQINLFKVILKELNPEVIIIVNAKASHIFKQEFKNDLQFSDLKGYHLLNNKIPIFFSGMLTGQRALDKHSYERLVWHIQQSIKNENSS